MQQLVASGRIDDTRHRNDGVNRRADGTHHRDSHDIAADHAGGIGDRVHAVSVNFEGEVAAITLDLWKP